MTRPIRLLHVIPSLYRGGAEMNLLTMTQAIDRAYFQIEVAYMQPYDQLVPDFAALNVPTHPLNAPRMIEPAGMLKLAGLIRRGHFDIVHTHLYPADLYAYQASFLTRLPVWVSTHHNELPIVKKPIHRQLSRLMSRKQTAIVAISESVRRFIEPLTVSPAKICVIPYGLDAERFTAPLMSGPCVSRADLGLRADDFVLTLIGRLEPQKGHRYAIDALAQIVGAYPRIKLLFVGHGQQEEALKAQALQLGDRVQFLGMRTDVAALLALSDAELLPSLYEGFGMVLLEAMAVRKPIIASDVGPISEIVIDGVTGLLVPPKESHALAAAILRLQAAPEWAVTLGNAGYTRLTQLFTLGRMTRQIEALYRRVVEKSL